MLPLKIPVSDATRVAEVRRSAAAAAEAEGFTGPAVEEVAIIATEVATNLLKHAVGGEVHITTLSAAGENGVEVLSVDRGPGMANVHACMTDGYSTAGTQGTGMGAISRLADVFDAFSQVSRGTVLVARKYLLPKQRRRAQTWTFGVVRVPYPGETACGDNWGIRRHGARTLMLVADGLGHGLLAAEASSLAVQTFQNAQNEFLAVPLLERVHLALPATRGAAVAVACIEDHSVQYAGLGNISGVLLGGPRAQVMVSHNGTAGLAARRFQEFTYTLPAEATIVMHSDGIATSWSVDAYPGLLRRHPSVIAGVLYRDATRGRDDACVVVGRIIGE
ncbi:MAG: ATP-binding SpoIIE family protein phosphatase [Bryobacteraceae bacterium]